MAIPHGSICVYNVLGMRKLQSIPRHFETLELQSNVDIPKLDSWIYENYDGRYSISSELSLDESGKIIRKNVLGMEDHVELSMVIMTCPYLNQ